MAVEKPGGSDAPSATATNPGPSPGTDTAPARTISTQTLSKGVQSRAPARPARVIGSRPYREFSTPPPPDFCNAIVPPPIKHAINQNSCARRHLTRSSDSPPPIALSRSRGCERPGSWVACSFGRRPSTPTEDQHAPARRERCGSARLAPMCSARKRRTKSRIQAMRCRKRLSHATITGCSRFPIEPAHRRP